MMRSDVRRAVFLCFALLLAVLAMALLRFHSRRSADLYPAGTLPPISFWYWHSPFVLSPDDTKTLQDLGVRELFVRAATLTYSGDPNDPVRASLRQTWPAPPKVKTSVAANTAFHLQIHLVFPVDATLVRRFEGLPEETFAQSMVQAIETEWQRAAMQMPGAIVGVQIDLDCPTRLLGRYAAVLKRVRSRLPRTNALSITLLTSWYDSRRLRGLLDAVDFSVPQFYEAQTSTTRSQFHPISNLSRLPRRLHQAAQLEKPFFVGLPIYGHALVYDGTGRLRGLFHDASAADLLARPHDFRFLGAAPLNEQGQDAKVPEAFIGEERVEFGPARAGTAFQLTYDLPTPDLLRRHLERLRAERLPRTCRGIILYRFPERGQEAVLPLATVAAVVQGNPPQPNVQLQVRTRRTAAFDLVESPQPGPPRTDLYVTVINSGTGPSRVAPDAVTVDLRFQKAQLETARLGTFNDLEGFAGVPEARASVARADTLRYRVTHLAPGERRILGPVTLIARPSATVSAQWRVVLPGGFDTLRKNILPVLLTPGKGK